MVTAYYFHFLCLLFPLQGEGTLTPGMIFSAFALKLFWKGESIGHEAHSTVSHTLLTPTQWSVVHV